MEDRKSPSPFSKPLEDIILSLHLKSIYIAERKVSSHNHIAEIDKKE